MTTINTTVYALMSAAEDVEEIHDQWPGRTVLTLQVDGLGKVLLVSTHRWAAIAIQGMLQSHDWETAMEKLRKQFRPPEKSQ